MSSWQNLETELKSWVSAGRQPTLWWRDDDAEASSDQLRRMLELSERHHAPIALAAIPATAAPELGRLVADHGERLTVLVHGNNHRNHERGNTKKSEFGPDRTAAAVAADLTAALERTRSLFGPLARPILVPPWNRLADRHLPLLHSTGYRGLSAKGPRPLPVTDVTVADVHVDIIAWRAGRGFAGEGAVLSELVAHLGRRRRQEIDEKTGLLTHHRVLDDVAWSFVEKLLIVSRGLGAEWVDVDRVFGPGT